MTTPSEQRNFNRSHEAVVDVLHLAKINENDIAAVSQAIYFTDQNLHANNFKLLQLNNEMCKEINEGQTLYVKGEPDEDLVICSDSRTYDVTETETSNSLILTTGMKFYEDVKDAENRDISSVAIHGIFYEYLEVTVGKPHFQKLYKILEKSMYSGPEHEYKIDKENLLSLEDLNNVIQASREELEKYLDATDTVIINNKVRLLDFEYHFRVLSFMLKLIDENSWALDEVDFDETINSLQDLVPREVLCGLFEKYVEESKIIDGLQLYRYKEDKVCKFFAQVILHNAGKFNLNEFLQAWQESVPEGMNPNEEILYGIAIIDRKSNPNVIWAFSEEKLPEKINDRFKVLFETKEKWTVPEIAPYIRRLATDKLNVNALLAKYARASTENGIKYYSAKHSK